MFNLSFKLFVGTKLVFSFYTSSVSALNFVRLILDFVGQHLPRFVLIGFGCFCLGFIVQQHGSFLFALVQNLLKSFGFLEIGITLVNVVQVRIVNCTKSFIIGIELSIKKKV